MKHAINYQENYVDQTLKAFCLCGWWVEDEQEEVFAKAGDHIAASKGAPVVSLAAAAVTDVDRDAAKYFRELADRIDNGDIGNVVVAFNDKAGNHFERFGNWKDRWQMLGALEYAKFIIDRDS